MSVRHAHSPRANAAVQAQNDKEQAAFEQELRELSRLIEQVAPAGWQPHARRASRVVRPRMHACRQPVVCCTDPDGAAGPWPFAATVALVRACVRRIECMIEFERAPSACSHKIGTARADGGVARQNRAL